MKWLTKTEIVRRARSKKGALEVSYEHWDQLYNATAKELRAEIDRVGSELYYTTYCGLCAYYSVDYRSCCDCIFNHFCSGEGALWYIAKTSLVNWLEKNGDWHTWKRASKAIRDKLKELSDIVSCCGYKCGEAKPLIDQALTIWKKQQPPVGDFTKDFREQIGRQAVGIGSVGTIRKMAIEACDRLDREVSKKDDLLALLGQIIDLETECCPRCEGNGRLYADGKGHLLSENAETILCGNCGGSGRILPEDAQDIAEVAITKYQSQEGELEI